VPSGKKPHPLTQSVWPWRVATVAAVVRRAGRRCAAVGLQLLPPHSHDHPAFGHVP
jgi:hypothetical protein